MIANGIQTRPAGARVASGRAAKGRVRLGRRVSEPVVGLGAATLKSVLQAEPVANLVHRGATHVVLAPGAAGNNIVAHGAAVEEPLVGRAGDVGHRVVAQAGNVGREILDVVQIQILVCALAQRLFHVEFVLCLGPSWVDGVVGLLESEAYAALGEVLVESDYLEIDLILLEPGVSFQVVLVGAFSIP